MAAQQRLYRHLEQLTPEQREWIEALLAEDECRLIEILTNDK